MRDFADQDISAIRPITIARLRRHADPTLAPPWEGSSALAPAMVRRALSFGTFQNASEPLPPGRHDPMRHAERIACLMVQGWQDPISIDVGVPWALGHVPTWIVQDGNHRLYAAILMGRERIEAELGGCLATCREMFGVDI